MASPLILILLGARVNFSAVGDMKKELAVGVIQRLVLAPAAGFGMAFLAQGLGFFAVTPAVLSALVGMYGSPVASASAVMAEEMGGDAELARQLCGMDLRLQYDHAVPVDFSAAGGRAAVTGTG